MYYTVLCIIQYYIYYYYPSQQYKVTKVTPQQMLVARLRSGRNGSGGVRVEAPCIACMHMSSPVVARWSLRLSDSYGVRLSGATIPWALRAPARALWPRCMPAPVLHTTTRCARVRSTIGRNTEQFLVLCIILYYILYCILFVLCITAP